jgi:hypothetical protein
LKKQLEFDIERLNAAARSMALELPFSVVNGWGPNEVQKKSSLIKWAAIEDKGILCSY